MYPITINISISTAIIVLGSKIPVAHIIVSIGTLCADVLGRFTGHKVL